MVEEGEDGDGDEYVRKNDEKLVFDQWIENQSMIMIVMYLNYL